MDQMKLLILSLIMSVLGVAVTLYGSATKGIKTLLLGISLTAAVGILLIILLIVFINGLRSGM